MRKTKINPDTEAAINELEGSIFPQLVTSLKEAIEISKERKITNPDTIAAIKELEGDLPWEEQTSMMKPRTSEAEFIGKLNKPLEPWEQCPDVWKTKAMFFQWMRGQMRRAWSRHPVKVSYMHNHRKRVPLGKITKKNTTGMVWGCECEHCHKDFKQSECEVDHLNAAGSFKGWDDFEAWMIKLMHINWDSIRVVCKTCHRIISYAERQGMTFEEAKLEKEVIAFTKLTPKVQKGILVTMSTELKFKGSPPMGNAKERRSSMKYLLLIRVQEKL